MNGNRSPGRDAEPGRTIVFHRHGEQTLLAIATLLIAGVADRLRGRDIGLILTDAAQRFLVMKDRDPAMGARPLRRTIQREIEDALSEKVLRGELRPGQVVLIDCAGNPDEPGRARLTFHTADPAIDEAVPFRG